MTNSPASSEDFVVAGARGLIASHAISGLRRAGKRIVCLADNDASLWGRSLEGIPVLSPAEAASTFNSAVFVAAIFTHTPLRRQLATLGARSVISYACLFRRYPEFFLPYFAVDDPVKVDRDAERARAAEDVWADGHSAELYRALIRWHRDLDSDAVPTPSPMREMYFPPFLQLRPDEVFVDCGAFDGDTVREYLRACGGQYSHIFALEPDPDTYTRLHAAFGRTPRVSALNVAAGPSDGEVPFLAAGAPASHVSASGANGLTVGGASMSARTIRLDTLQPRPTFVKMDIEGYEMEALQGCSDLIREFDTAFAVALYHRMEDLWNVPMFFHQRASSLKLVLRHYAEDWAETVCYAIPAARLRTAALQVLPIEH